MATTKKRFANLDPEESAKIHYKLLLMVEDGTYNTNPTYSPDGELYPGNLIPFVDKHMNYLRSHPSADPYQYIANLRLMTRIR